MPSEQAIKNQQDIAAIRKKLLSGKLTYNDAADQAAPIIKRINEQARAIAKRHGMRPKLISFTELMR